MEKINGILDAGVQNELRRRFNPDGSLLRKHQLRALKILKEVHDLCTRHGIRYYLCSGTLLGAVRHGGFIPWDDDVDIEMRWTDYLKFLKYAKRELKGKYKLQTHATDSNYFMTFAKVRDESTFMAEYTGKDRRFKYRGIFIDIFYTERILRLFAVITWRLKVWNVSLSSKNPYSVLKPVCTLFYYLNHYVLHMAFRVLNLPFLPFCHSYLAMGHGFLGKRDNKDIFPLTTISFEGMEFNCPRDWDSYLRKIYGDYEKLPDLDKLHIHSVETIIP